MSGKAAKAHTHAAGMAFMRAFIAALTLADDLAGVYRQSPRQLSDDDDVVILTMNQLLVLAGEVRHPHPPR